MEPIRTPLLAEDLPASVVDLLVVIGLDGVTRLMENFGGTRIWIPFEYHPGDAISKTLGEEATRRLIRYARLQQILVPIGAQARRKARDRVLIARRAEGATVRELAKEYRLGERAVWRILKKAEA